jgi:site-specific recombinase XerD
MYTGWEKVWKLDISNNTKRKYLITMRLYADFLISKKLVEVNYPREMKVPRVQKALPFCMGRDNYIHIYNAIHRRW